MTAKPGACPSYEDLSAFHDGELPEKRWQEVSEHVSTCASCAEALAGIRRTAGLLAELPRVEPDELVLQRALNAARSSGGRRGLSRFVTLGLAATMLIGALVAWRAMNLRMPQETLSESHVKVAASESRAPVASAAPNEALDDASPPVALDDSRRQADSVSTSLPYAALPPPPPTVADGRVGAGPGDTVDTVKRRERANGFEEAGGRTAAVAQARAPSPIASPAAVAPSTPAPAVGAAMEQDAPAELYARQEAAKGKLEAVEVRDAEKETRARSQAESEGSVGAETKSASPALGEREAQAKKDSAMAEQERLQAAPVPPTATTLSRDEAPRGDSDLGETQAERDAELAGAASRARPTSDVGLTSAPAGPPAQPQVASTVAPAEPPAPAAPCPAGADPVAVGPPGTPSAHPEIVLPPWVATLPALVDEDAAADWGAVTASYLVTTNGTTAERLLSGKPAAVDALGQALLRVTPRPATCAGRPVAVRVVVRYRAQRLGWTGQLLAPAP